MTDQCSGGCLCGNVRYTVDGSFDAFFLCHCTYCQKDTGSAHAANLFSQHATLSWQKGQEHIKTFTLPGTRHTKSFCTECGSALPRVEMDGALLVVPAGSIDKGAVKQPDAHIMMASKADWDDELYQVAKLDGMPS